MKRFLLALILAAAMGQAGTFTDTFSAGLNPANWTVVPWPSPPGIYTVSNPAGGGVLLEKTVDNPGIQENIGLYFNMALLGGAVSGDFAMQVDFDNAVITGGGLDQVEFHAVFADNSGFFDVRDTSNVHAYTGGYWPGMQTDATSGTFGITRAGPTITEFFNGSPLVILNWSNQDLTQIGLFLQNNSGSNDNTSVRFSNFSITAAGVNPPSTDAIPEPATWLLLGTVLVGMGSLRRRRNR